MKIEKITVQACCGKTSTIFKTDQPLSLAHLEALVKMGFVEAAHFTKAGILYVDNPDFIVTGPLGSDRLQIKCKISDCSSKIDELEVLIQKIG